jgi:hypothetical protein
MTSLFLGNVVQTGVPADEKVVRSTAAPYYADKPAAMATSAPDMQELEIDSDPNLGLAHRQRGSMWVEGSRVQHDADIVATQNVSNQMVNSQVSTSGTAASREAEGQTHKNASYAVGIEPVYDLADPNHKMGNTYFVRNERTVQEPAGNYMSVPPGMDTGAGAEAGITAYGKTAARDAAQAGQYKLFGDWLNGTANG